MKGYIALFGLATSAHALEFSHSQCTNSSVYHATILSTKASTATFTSIPTNANNVSVQHTGNSPSTSATITQPHIVTGSTTSEQYGSATTYPSIHAPFSFATSDTSLNAASSSQEQPHTDATSGANDGSSNKGSISLSHSVGALPTSQSSLQSPHIPTTTLVVSTITPSGNSSSPKSSLVPFTGSSSTNSVSGGAIVVGLFFTALFL
ncbi:hypothetical protein M436DRAFT_57709 [Aureobasidium namibiae CBS 147.97]|uniref:GPI anchored protein n=1 Tax=Aureobasidium namibiae CBS 147.97 TaxID=1043004 RepID=A0A074W769_9PEZI|nr:uncharacterized protein M436DRAFT_57709 [Aureobasidium namibiae CBS 147.97]KEQ68703.1 hypothetical protein M436DRAFT_57709 [Aureobasidium namibiae CBS 147.97]